MSSHSVATHDYERVLVKIVRALPPNRAEQLVDFARFLESKVLTEEMMQEEDAEEIAADNARWDDLLASNKAQHVLEALASEAAEEHRSGRTTPMAFSDEGRVLPG